MTARLAGRVIVVTGATGIAATSAQRLATEGASVFTISLIEDHCEALHEAIGETGGTHAWATADLRDEEATVSAFAACMERFGHIDGLLAVAGGAVAASATVWSIPSRSKRGRRRST